MLISLTFKFWPSVIAVAESLAYKEKLKEEIRWKSDQGELPIWIASKNHQAIWAIYICQVTKMWVAEREQREVEELRQLKEEVKKSRRSLVKFMASVNHWKICQL